MNRKPIPERLHAAYEWIDCADEWAEALSDSDYPEQAAANAQEQGQRDVNESDLYAVIELRRAMREGES